MFIFFQGQEVVSSVFFVGIVVESALVRSCCSYSSETGLVLVVVGSMALFVIVHAIKESRCWMREECERGEEELRTIRKKGRGVEQRRDNGKKKSKKKYQKELIFIYFIDEQNKYSTTKMNPATWLTLHFRHPCSSNVSKVKEEQEERPPWQLRSPGDDFSDTIRSLFLAGPIPASVICG